MGTGLLTRTRLLASPKPTSSALNTGAPLFLLNEASHEKTPWLKEKGLENQGTDQCVPNPSRDPMLEHAVYWVVFLCGILVNE